MVCPIWFPSQLKENLKCTSEHNVCIIGPNPKRDLQKKTLYSVLAEAFEDPTLPKWSSGLNVHFAGLEYQGDPQIHCRANCTQGKFKC